MQRLRNADEVQDRKITLATFNLTHMASINTGSQGKTFLGKPAFDPAAPQRGADSDQVVFVIELS